VISIKHGELDSIKANQAELCAEPEVTVAGLQDGPNKILRQAMLAVPVRDVEIPVDRQA
jgi:hypothetical protein